MRLIDADAFEKFIKEKYKDGEETDDIKDQMLFDLSYQPTIEAVPVVHGEWVVKDEILGIKILKCSVCGSEHPQLPRSYCGDCGAKMDGGKE